MALLRTITPLALASMLAACGPSTGYGVSSPSIPGTNPPTSSGNVVNATPSIAFSPARLSVVAGATVTFAFGSVGHNVFFDNDSAGAPANIEGVNANKSVQRTFTTPGTYNFDCHIHPGMHGAVVVAPPDTTN